MMHTNPSQEKNSLLDLSSLSCRIHPVHKGRRNSDEDYKANNHRNTDKSLGKVTFHPTKIRTIHEIDRIEDHCTKKDVWYSSTEISQLRLRHKQIWYKISKGLLPKEGHRHTIRGLERIDLSLCQDRYETINLARQAVLREQEQQRHLRQQQQQQQHHHQQQGEAHQQQRLARLYPADEAIATVYQKHGAHSCQATAFATGLMDYEATMNFDSFRIRFKSNENSKIMKNSVHHHYMNMINKLREETAAAKATATAATAATAATVATTETTTVTAEETTTIAIAAEAATTAVTEATEAATAAATTTKLTEKAETTETPTTTTTTTTIIVSEGGEKSLPDKSSFVGRTRSRMMVLFRGR